MLKKIILFSVFCVASLFANDKLNGAGASFPAPAYTAWAYMYEAETKNQVNYQSIGSGGGIKQVTGRVVDFGASDEPLEKNAITKDDLLQFPALVGSIVLAHNVKGVKDSELKLKNEVLADIFLGKITKWNDPKIAQDNPNIKLPNETINVVRRSDGSGTTFNFTSFLAGVSKEWQDGYGVGKAVEWPVGVAAKGNEGIAALVKQTPNSIGYLENAYALSNQLARTTLTTKSGKWVEPSDNNFKAAALQAKWSKDNDFYQMLVLQEGDNTYPIVAATFILLPAEKAKENKLVTAFFNWAFNKGDETIAKLGYVPLPSETKDLIREYWADKNISPTK
ncbi:MAG: phosphate ABC transporter substrate-binding protein PstS [Campylobacteraceae bacterium]|nr:phosphate ABC transporter substrate-binding protein PstS [Campylobacteraceae bacterium]